MYQREAMWISFGTIRDCAVKISVGGVNALTGLSQNVSEPGKQDYLALSRNDSGQLYVTCLNKSNQIPGPYPYLGGL